MWSLISILQKWFPARSVFTSSCLTTASNSGISSASRAQGRSQWQLHSNCLFSSQSLVQNWIGCPVYLPDNSFAQFPTVAWASVAAGMYLPSRCLETNIVSELFASNGCCSGSITITMVYGMFTTLSNNNLTPPGCPIIWKTRTQFTRKADFMCCTPMSLQGPAGRMWWLPSSG
jgi:hypothetical protein